MGFSGNEMFPADAIIAEENLFADILDGADCCEPTTSNNIRNFEVADGLYSQGTLYRFERYLYLLHFLAFPTLSQINELKHLVLYLNHLVAKEN